MKSHTVRVWEIEVTDQFDEWWSTLTDDQREAVTDRVDVLAERGPDLGRPIVDRIHSSRHQSMKELRAAKGGALRVLFCFDPRRQAILLLGGDKTGAWNEWYEWAVPLADDLYDEYLNELGKEGLI
ncbi:MAG: type II toxin-antitoxin system RelE/ParE family toxin [Actinomycetota bacterium]